MSHPTRPTRFARRRFWLVLPFIVAQALVGRSAFAACGTTKVVLQAGGGDCNTIQACVDLIPATLTGDYCIDVQDSATYAENVVVQGRTNAGYTISIGPFSAQRPVLDPPSGVGFRLNQSSVNLFGFDIAPTNAMTHGVVISSGYVTISSVNVQDAGGMISATGLTLSSWTTVSYTSVTVANAVGLLLPGSTMTAISFSSVVANGAPGYAIHFIGASSNTLTQIFASNTSGRAAYIDSSNNNTFVRSTFTSVSATAALLFSNASSNTIVDLYAANIQGSGLVIGNGSHDNVVVQSTFSSASTSGYIALIVTASDFNTISRVNAYCLSGTGNGAVFFQSATHNTLSLSRLACLTNGYSLVLFRASSNTITNVFATNSIGYGAALLTNSSFNTISQSTITNNTSTVGALEVSGDSSFNTFSQDYFGNLSGHGGSLSSSNSNTLQQSTFSTNNALKYALFLSIASSNTITLSVASNPQGTAAYFSSNSNGNFVSLSSFTSRGANYSGLSLESVSSNTIDSSYIQGSTGVSVLSSTGTVVRGSVLVATNTFGTALAMRAAYNLTLATSTLQGGFSGRAFSLAPDNTGVVSVGSVTVTGSARGIEISTQAAGFVLAIDSITFRNLTAGATAIHFLGGTFVSTITLANFEDTSIGANVSGAALDLASRITMSAHFGVRTGPNYENDPNSLVDWLGVDSFPGCFLAVKVGAGQTYATISDAIAALPSSLAGRTCVVIEDGATYAEQVTVRNFVNNGYQLAIFADPTSGLTPTVTPPVASTAAFHILNDTVSVQGINVVVDQTIPYGVYGSSAYAALTDITVSTNGGLGIYNAGVRMSSYSSISDSTITVTNAYGIRFTTSTNNTVIRSSVSTNSQFHAALFLTNVDSAAVTGSYFANPSGHGALLDLGTKKITIAQSTMTSHNAQYSGLYMRATASNTVTGSLMSNPMGNGVVIDTDCAYNIVDLSTMTSSSAPFVAMLMRAASSNTVTKSYIANLTGNAAFLDTAANSNTISLSVIVSSGGSGSALVMRGASTNTITNDTIYNPSGFGALLMAGSSGNVITLSTVTSNAAGLSALSFWDSSSNVVTRSIIANPSGLGVTFETGSNSNTLSQSSVTNNSATYQGILIRGNGNLVSGVFAQNYPGDVLYLDSGASYNTVTLSTMSTSAILSRALYITTATFNTVTRSYLLNPSGNSAVLSTNANSNTISLSTMSSNSTGTALKLDGASTNTITQSMMLNPSGSALLNNNGNSNMISLSTLASAGASYPAAYFEGASSNTLTQSYISNPNGYGVLLYTNANANTISGSTINSTNVTYQALYLSGASSNTITQIKVANTSGYAAYLTAGANGNIVSQSTITNSGIVPALFLGDVSTNTLDSLYVQGSTAAIIDHSTATAIRGSVFVGLGGNALTLRGGSSGLVLATSTLRGISASLLIEAGNSGTLSIGSVTVTSSYRGIDISTQAAGFVLAIDSITFRSMSGATAIYFGGGTFVSTITLANFEDATIGTNVSGATLSLASRITMNAHYGMRTGPTYENDPNSLVDWSGAANYPGCVVTNNVGAGQTYAMIQAGVNALPGTLTGRSCVVIRDGATYPEQVTVQNFVNAGNTIAIFADPGSGLRPVVSPPAASTAAFKVANASVSITGIDIAPTNVMTYGVYLSSAYVLISSVNILDAGAKISNSGILLSSWTTINYTSITAAGVIGLRLPGSVFSTIMFSSVVVQSAALWLSGASSNTITASYMSSPSSDAALIDSNSHDNTISLSTMSSNSVGFRGLYMAGTAFNIITRSYIVNPSGNAAVLTTNANSNTISLSTVVSNSISAALFLNAASSNTVTQSLLTNPSGTGLLNTNANGNTISFSTLTSAGADYSAAYFVGASSNTLTQSYFTNPNGYGVFLYTNANANTISFSTMSSNIATAQALYLSGASSNTITQSYVANPSGYAAILATQANGNAISSSTFASASSIYPALSLSNVSSSSLNSLYVQGSTAASVNGSTGTIIQGSVFVATNTSGNALNLQGGSSGLILANSALRGGASGRGLLFTPGNSGTVSIGSVTVTGSARGLEISTQAAGFALAIDSITFRSLAAGATAIHFLGGTFVSTITLANFEDTSIGANVSGAALALASRIAMNTFSGTRTGPTYENDPNSLVDWLGATPYPGCAVTNNVGVGQTYATISAGLAALPGTLSGRSCVVIRDGATYAELITVANFVNNGNQIAIFADPTSGLRPVVSPPAASVAAFWILNTSVSVAGIDILPTNAMPYGIYASSAYAAISDVNVQDGAGRITNAGIFIPSWSSLSNATVDLGASSAHALTLWGSSRTAVVDSTFTASGFGASDVVLTNASSNTFTRTFMTTLIGDVLDLTGSDYNSFSVSTFSVLITGIAVHFSTSSYNSIDSSYARGFSNAMTIDGSTGTVVRASRIVAITGGAMLVTGGSNGLALTNSTVIGAAGSTDLSLISGNSGLVSVASVTFTGGSTGMSISTQAAGFALGIDSVTFQNLSPGATAIHFLGGTFVSTITLANFADTTIGANVSAAALALASRISMRSHYGTRTGPLYENDPNALVDWFVTSAARAAMSCPLTGARVNGNRLTLFAELTSTSAALNVLFQYKAAASQTWIAVSTVVASDANPNTSGMYFVHWDVSALAAGNYDVRAVATDLSNLPDTSPTQISVTVEPVTPDIDESNFSGFIRIQQQIYDSVDNTVCSAGLGTVVAKVVVPSGALNTSTTTMTIVIGQPLPATPPQGGVYTGMSIDISMANSQTLLSGGRTAALTMYYPDSNLDGLVDGTSVTGSRLRLFTYGASGWTRDFASSANTTLRSVSGSTPHFSVFAAFPATSAIPGNARVYPVPYRPNGSNSDQGIPYSASNSDSGIIFDGLLAGWSVRVYTASGRLVWSSNEADSTGRIQWDVKNGGGHDVASGAYMVVINMPGLGSQVKKISIIR